MRVLIVDANRHSARMVMQSLKSSGAVVDHSETGDDALGIVKRYDYDIILLDLDLPDMGGYEVLKRMRCSKLGTPVMITSSLTRTQAKVKAFAAGADDYACKPFDLQELQARVMAIVRRSKGYSQPMLRVGSVQLNLETRDATVNGEQMPLTNKEYAILELLMIRKGMVLSKEAFLNHIYGGMDEPDPKIVDVFICKLRRKLAAAGAQSVIETVWGRGYTVKNQAVVKAPVERERQLEAA